MTGERKNTKSPIWGTPAFTFRALAMMGCRAHPRFSGTEVGANVEAWREQAQRKRITWRGPEPPC